MRIVTTALLLVLTLSVLSAHADETTSDLWDRLHIGGGYAGFVHTVTKAVGAGEDARVEVRTVSEITLKRMGQVTEIESASHSFETPDGKLLRIVSKSKMSAQESGSVHTFADGKLTIETEMMGTTRTVEQAVPKDLAGPGFIGRETIKLAGTTGETIEFTTYMADVGGVVTVTIVSKGMETIELPDGSSRELTRVESTLKSGQAEAAPVIMRPITWLDANGITAKTHVEMAGMVIETFHAKDEASAKDAGAQTPATRPDVFTQTFLTERDPVPVPRQLEEAIVVISKRRPDATLPDLGASGLDVTTLDDGSLRVHAKRRVPPTGGTRPLADPPAALADALGSSSMIQSDADEIQKIALEVVGDDTDAWRSAQKLERWVFENMTRKNMKVAFASALEACRTREGDCSEHAVLLAALGRAAGIPTRVVMGLEYLFGIWGGHAWNEVYIEGAWYPLDGTNGYGFVDPLHLPMAHMTMKDGAGNEMLPLITILGNIDVDITDVVRDGRKIRIQDSDTLVTHDAKTYCNRIWSIQFKAPAGYTFDPPSGKGISARLMEMDGTTADGKKVEIEVDAMDAPSGDPWAELMRRRPESSEIVERKVDGRVARGMTETRDGRSKTRIAVVVDNALFIFTLDRAGGEVEAAAFESFLQSVDFDVK